MKTVYLAFETKSGVLRAVWHLLLRGDEDPAPVGERSGIAMSWRSRIRSVK